MKRGKFAFTGEPLQFCGGFCGNGQHRCGAVIYSKVSIIMNFICKIEKEALKHIDVGQRRTYAHWLGGRGVSYPRHVAAIVSTYSRYLKNPDICKVKSGDTYDDLDAVFNRCQEEFIRAAKEGRKLRKMIPVSVAGLFYLLIHRKRPDELVRFWDALKDGANLGSRSPILYLREEVVKRKIAQHSRGRRTSSSEWLALLIITWNSCRRKSNRKPVWRTKSNSNEKMPTPILND